MHRTTDPSARASKNSDLVLHSGRALKINRISAATGNLHVGWPAASCTSTGIFFRYADITLRGAVFILPREEGFFVHISFFIHHKTKGNTTNKRAAISRRQRSVPAEPSRVSTSPSEFSCMHPLESTNTGMVNEPPPDLGVVLKRGRHPARRTTRGGSACSLIRKFTPFLRPRAPGSRAMP